MIELNHDIVNAYRTAQPFPHGLYTGLLSQDLLHEATREILRALNIIDPKIWLIKRTPTSRKLSCNKIHKIGPSVVKIHDQLMSEYFTKLLSNLTGIEHLVGDDTLDGAGVHAIRRGGFLNVHADFNYHKVLQKYRRVNILLYLNEDWPASYGGNLELWNRTMTKCAAFYEPLFGHCVIFTSSDYSYHGHPAPLNCPKNRYIISIAADHYTKEKGNETDEKCHSTLYQ